ncbi:MAG: hypothetical protein OEQ16_15405, partial [Gammaproteobacteria bacterium]|nr:hypothetical protein [Gammaproteobacteria bacterium]
PTVARVPFGVSPTQSHFLTIHQQGNAAREKLSPVERLEMLLHARVGICESKTEDTQKARWNQLVTFG